MIKHTFKRLINHGLSLKSMCNFSFIVSLCNVHNLAISYFNYPYLLHSGLLWAAHDFILCMLVN